MSFNIDNLLVDRVLRVTMFNGTTGAVNFTANQVESPSLECGGEQVIATDAVGAPIATFDRSKTSKFSAESSHINLGMLATQLGTSKEIGTPETKIRTPKFEVLTVGAVADVVNTSVSLTETPVGATGAEVKYIYLLSPDKSISTKFEVGATPATNFSITGKVITLPSGTTFLATDLIAVWYDYDEENAIKIVNSGTKFAPSGKFDVEVLFADVCNQETKYYGHIIFPKGKLSGNVTNALTTEGKHPVEFDGMSDYCDDDKTQFYYVIPQ